MSGIPAIDKLHPLMLAAYNAWGRYQSAAGEIELAPNRLALIRHRLKIGARCAWLFDEDSDGERKFIHCPDRWFYSGIIIPWPDQELRGSALEIDQAVIVITEYPCEKTYVEVDWVPLEAMLANPTLKAFHVFDAEEIPAMSASDIPPKEFMGESSNYCPPQPGFGISEMVLKDPTFLKRFGLEPFGSEVKPDPAGIPRDSSGRAVGPHII